MSKEALQTQLAQVEKQLADMAGLQDTLSPEQFQAATSPLQEKKAELEAQLSGTTYSATTSGTGIIVQGTGNTVVGERGVHVGGNIEGSIITGDGSTVGGIRAHTIKADNVVQGMQQIGGKADEAAQLVQLAQALSQGSISANSIEAKNVVAGLQYIADPTQATTEQLRQEVAHLKSQLAEAIAAGEMDAAGDAEDVQNALDEADTELAKPEPQGNRIVRKLKSVTDILTESATVAQKAGKVGVAIIKLAPVAATLYQIAVNIFR